MKPSGLEEALRSGRSGETALQPGVRSGKGARSGAREESLMGNILVQPSCLQKQEQDPEEAEEGGI